MEILIKNRRCSPAKLKKDYPNHEILDLSSKGESPWVKFSPFFPHGGIPVPNYPQYTSQSVEGVWQGLKVFEQHGIDPGKFEISNMKGLKRTVRKFGQCLGHAAGADKLLGYLEARRAIYLPTYRWVLEHCLQNELARLRALAQTSPLIFLDYETNPDLTNLKSPLSHAALVVRFLDGSWP